MRSFFYVLLSLLFVGVMCVAAREAWGDEPGSVASSQKHHGEYHTAQSALVTSLSGGASGTIKLVCNGGYDTDRIVIKGSHLQPDTDYTVWFVDPETQRRVAPPSNVARTDAAGGFRWEVVGSICPLPAYAKVAVAQKGLTVLSGALKTTGQ